MNVVYEDGQNLAFSFHWRDWMKANGQTSYAFPATRADAVGRSLAANVPPAFCDYLVAKNFPCEIQPVLTFHQDDLFHPFDDFGCVISSDSPRHQFALDGAVLEKVLGGPHSIMAEANIRLCDKNRAVIEKACERAHARTAGYQSPPIPKLIKVLDVDFRVGPASAVQ
jgi:hypothetical protein